jgi:HK97 family phage portal protein
MRLAAVFSCVRVLSEDRAALPIKLYRRNPRGRAEVSDHWLSQLLEEPNAWQTGFEFREMEQAHLELSGMFFALKTIVRGEIVELLPTSPARWSVELRRNGNCNSNSRFLMASRNPCRPENVYFQRGLTLNGYTGVSPIEYMRETIGFGQALTKYGSRLFRNGANVGGVLEHQAG